MRPNLSRREKVRIFWFVLIILATMTASLWCVWYRMKPGSEEAGFSLWGFPFTMVEAGPFYAWKIGSIPPKLIGDYIRNDPWAFDNPRINYLGILGNLVFYTVIIGIPYFGVLKKRPAGIPPSDLPKPPQIPPP